MKAGDKPKVAALRMVVCELQNEAKRTRTELDESAELAVLRRELKKRQESMEAFRAGGREDLAGFEEYAAGLIEGLLPEQMGETELSALIDSVIADTGAASARDMGKVMAAVMAAGRGPGRRQGGFPAGQGASIRVRRARPNHEGSRKFRGGEPA